jgi:starch-binding outer membrane protein, SusD/RagB family
MKKYIILGICLILLNSGCKKKELELRPFNQIETTQAFNNENDANLALNGMYYGLRVSGSYYVGSWNIIGDLAADNLIISVGGRQSQVVFSNWLYNGDNTSGLFAGGYTMVRRANAILENADKVQGSTPAFINNLKGQALACRAMVYFDLARVYGKTPLTITATDNLTIPYVTSTDPTIKPSKEPVVDVYNKIISDLTTANNLIAITNPSGRLNKAAVNGLLSKVYLYKGDWPNCIAASNAALGTTPVLPNIAGFPGIWTDAAGDAGVLFKIKNTLVDGLNTMGTNYSQTVGGGIRSEYVVDYALRQLYLPNDVRTTTYFQTSPYNGVNQNHVIKYLGKAGFPAGVLDAKVLRTAEVLLNRAEAYYNLGGAANELLALADLNLLKTNRLTGYVNATLSGTALIDEIQLQRRLEMAFEGERLWDLKRRNLPVLRSNFGDRADGTGTTYVFSTLPAGDYKFSFPFPQSELNFNTNLKQVFGWPQ